MFLPRLCRIVLVPAVGLMFLGCDDGAAERNVRRDVELAHAKALEGSDESLQEARRLLESATAGGDASPATQANAKALLAQIELETARDAQRRIDQKMMDVSRLVADINQLAQQIATTNALVAGYRQYDPRGTLTAIEQSIAEATGGPNQAAWFTHDDAQIPTLTALRQDISRLEGELSELQDRLNQLNAQRSQVLTEADQASREAEGPRNEQTLAAFRRASELRKQAADLATEIDRTQAAMVPVRNDLGVAQSQQQVIEGLINDLQEEAEAQKQGWQMIQQQMAAQTQLARAILEGTAGGASQSLVPPGGSIAEKAAQLNQTVGELRELRAQAIENAENAAARYGEAVALAEQLRQDLQGRIRDPRNASRPERGSWQMMVDVMHPATFRLHQSSALRALAEIHGTGATEMTMRIELRNLLGPTLEAAGLPMSDALAAANLEREREQTIAAANEAFEQADAELQNIIEGSAQDDVQNAAYVARILTLYGWAQLNQLHGDERSARDHLELARQVHKTAAERNIAMPTLPPGLVGTPTTAPAARPAAATEPPDADDEPAADPDAAPPAPEEPAEPATDDPAAGAPVEPDPDTPTEPATEPTEPPAEPDPAADPEPGSDPGANEPG